MRSVAIFFAVAAATFAATDPSDLPPWAKALIGAGIAGLAAVGITPPGRSSDDIQDAFGRHREAIQNLAGRVNDLEGAHGHVIDRIEDLETVTPHPLETDAGLSVVPPPTPPPAPEVPS
jgi:hypothetical protein